MKKKLPLLLFASLLLSGCEPVGVKDVNVKFEVYREQIKDVEGFNVEADKILESIGVNDYKFSRFGNYSEAMSDMFHVDALYTTSHDPLIIRAFHASDSEWDITSIQNAKDEKYYYNTGVFADDYDIYSYQTGEIIKTGLSQYEKTVRAKETLNSLKNSPDAIKGTIKSHINSSFANTSIDSITINDDLGKGAGYIATINLTWAAQNSAGTSKDVLKLYSDDLAATIAQEYDTVHEIAIFWSVPYLTTKTSKWAYACHDGGAYLSDNVIGF